MEADNMQIDIVNKSVMCSTMQLLLQSSNCLSFHYVPETVQRRIPKNT